MKKTLKHILPKYTFLEHFADLKKRTIVVLIWFMAATAASYYFSQEIFQFLLQPLANSAAGPKKIIYTGLTEAFFTYLSLSAFTGFILSIPLIVLQVYAFISPGLYAAERRKAQILLLLSPILFILGSIFVFYFVIPKAWEFFISFEKVDDLVPIVLEAKISEYLSLVQKLIIAFGLAFQMPIILIVLSLFDIVSSSSLRNRRRLAIVINFIIAGIITPPDILSQISLAIPMVLLYEFSIMGIDYFRRKNARY